MMVSYDFQTARGFEFTALGQRNISPAKRSKQGLGGGPARLSCRRAALAALPYASRPQRPNECNILTK
jgi:hypothetical protein